MDAQSVIIPPSLQRFIQDRIAADGYSGLDHYIETLVRWDEETHKLLEPYTTGSELESLLIEGLESPDAGPMTDADWVRLRRSAQSAE